MKADKYISLGSKLSLLLVFTSALAIQFALNQLRMNRRLKDAREKFAEWVYYDQMIDYYQSFTDFHENEEFKPIFYYSKLYDGIGNSDVNANENEIRVRVGFDEPTDNPKPSSKVYDSHYWSETFSPAILHKKDGVSEIAGPLTKLVLTLSKVDDPKKAMMGAQQLERSYQLASIAQANELPIKDPKDAVSLFHDIQQQYYQQHMSVPVIQLNLKPVQASLALALIVCVLVIVIRSVVATILKDPTFGEGEPWLILDAETNPAVLLALAWIAGIGIGPLLASAALVITLILQSRLEGATDGIVLKLSIVCALIALVGVCVHASLFTIKDLHRLRVLRAKLSKRNN